MGNVGDWSWKLEVNSAYSLGLEVEPPFFSATLQLVHCYLGRVKLYRWTTLMLKIFTGDKMDVSVKVLVSLPTRCRTAPVD